MGKLFGLLCLLLACTTGHAGSFSVTPVRLFFEPKDKAVALTLMNEGDEDIVLQADVYRWTQGPDGADQTELTEDLMVSPPSLRLAAHSKQVVRLGLLVPREPSRAMSYRLVVREIPEAASRQDAVLQLPIALVLNMPVFITPAKGQRNIDCAWEIVAAGDASLSCLNTGSAYAQVRMAEIRREGLVLARNTGATYILPGVRKRLPLQLLSVPSLRPGIAELILVYDDLKTERQSLEIP